MAAAGAGVVPAFGAGGAVHDRAGLDVADRDQHDAWGACDSTGLSERRDGAAALDVLRNVNLSVEEGEFVSIVGASASGKTTLLKIAAGLVGPDRGTATIAGRPVDGFPHGASIVFQNYSLLPWLSALENVRLAVE